MIRVCPLRNDVVIARLCDMPTDALTPLVAESEREGLLRQRPSNAETADIGGYHHADFTDMRRP